MNAALNTRVVVFYFLAILSLVACAYFVSISAVSLFAWRIPPYWSGCFLLCSIALGGWKISRAKHYGPADQTGTRASHSATTYLIGGPKTHIL